ncbi:MAG: CoA transferase [Rhodospirillales bacterium]|nr:CoA transferase [Rhodospirillales bacterium]
MHDFNADEQGPLQGVRVLDMTRLIAGNMLSLQLADFGAEVIKIETPGRGDPLRAWQDDGVACHWKVYARNKKSVTLNLRDPEAIEILLRLVEGADAMIENFRPGRLEEMGLGPDVLHARNPKLVLARISGFGQTGPYRERPGFGSLVEAMSGFADRNGFADREPVLPPLALADMIAGLYGAMAVLIALREVETKGGNGQVIDLSLLEPIFSVLGPEALTHKVTGLVKQRLGSGSNTSSPRNAYPTRDGKWVALSASIQSMAERVFRVIGREDMIDDPRFRSNPDRVRHRDQVDEILGGWIKQRDQAEVLEIFGREEVTASGIFDISDIIKDEHFQGREVLVDLPDEDVGTAPMHNIIPRLSATPGKFRLPAPRLGEHNAALLGELGIDAGGLADLTDRGVI